MRLRDLLSYRSSWKDDDTIYVVQPWSCDAEALVTSEAPDAIAPVIRSGQRYEYFLEGFIARDLLDDLGAAEEVGKEDCDRFIQYAINDA